MDFGFTSVTARRGMATMAGQAVVRPWGLPTGQSRGTEAERQMAFQQTYGADAQRLSPLPRCLFDALDALLANGVVASGSPK